MASGDVVGIFYKVNLPRTLFAQPAARTGGSTPNELIPKYDFDDGTGDGTSEGECLDFYGQMSSKYSGGGVTVHLKWMAKSSTAGAVLWRAAFREVIEGGDDLDLSHSYDFNSVTANAPSTLGQIDYASITFTDGVDMDNVGANDMFILRINRYGDDASDNLPGDAELVGVVLVET